MTDFSNQTLLVTGASGQYGRLAVVELLARGAKKVIAASRDLGKIEDFKTLGVELRQLDFDDIANTGNAFQGVDRVLLISTDAVGRRVDQHVAAIEAAEKAGVKHVVYTSAPSPRPVVSHPTHDHFWTEARLFASTSLGWSIMRNNIYMEMVLMGAGPALAMGQWFDAAGDGRRAYVSRQDTVRAGVGALLGHDGKAIFEIGGGQALSQAEVAQLISEIAGKPVRRVSLSPQERRDGLVKAGLPEIMAGILVDFDVDIAEGRHTIVTDAVKVLSGTEPTTLKAFLAANKAALV